MKNRAFRVYLLDISVLLALCDEAHEFHHQFWPDEVSVRDRALFPELAQATSKALTDLYLLGLAAMKKACFATFDRRLDASVVRGGSRSLNVTLL